MDKVHRKNHKVRPRGFFADVLAFYSEKPAGDLIVGNVQKRYKKMESGVQNAKRVV